MEGYVSITDKNLLKISTEFVIFNKQKYLVNCCHNILFLLKLMSIFYVVSTLVNKIEMRVAGYLLHAEIKRNVKETF